MYYRKQEDIKRFERKAYFTHWWERGWYLSKKLGYYRNSKKHSRREQSYKKESNRRIRHNKNDYYLTKSNLCHREFDYW